MDSNSNTPRERLDWIDWIKGISILLIILNHISEELFIGTHLGNPHIGWPPLSERIAQWAPLPIHGLRDILANFVRYGGWIGEQAVSLFIIATGIGLALSCLRRGPNIDLAQFFKSRFARVFPIWIVAHLLILLPPALLGFRVSVGHPEFYLSLIGIRLDHHQVYYGIPAWWYVSLLLQLYLIFPLIFSGFKSYGRNQAVVVFILAGLACRFAGLMLLQENLDPWSRGTICVSRLAEFAFGIWFGFLVFENDQEMLNRLRSRRTICIALCAWLVGCLLGLTLWGMTFFCLLTGVAIFVLLYAMLTKSLMQALIRWIAPILSWLGRHSLSIFLVHHPIAFVLFRGQTGVDISGRSLLVRCILILFLSVIAAVMLEKSTDILTRWLNSAIANHGWKRVLGAAIGSLALVMLIIVPIELSIRKHSPQDIPDFGWSERPSLQPDEKLGFRLRTSSRTRLRWESYDYLVEGNSAGFPGPEFQWEKPTGTFRIMTLGDAYTSAEGVDTQQAWPRLLESQLNENATRNYEVINFGITGFGPNQYATITEDFAPRLNPDLIIIGFFTNDFWDVQVSADEFRDMIGFDHLPIDHWLGVITGRHLFRYLRGHVMEATFENLTGKPAPHTKFFLQQDAMDPSLIEDLLKGQQLVRERFQQIKTVADSIGSKVIVMAIPAPIQVVDRDQLGFLRPSVDWNTEHLDMNQPQRMAREIAEEAGFEFIDLRPALREGRALQPYQSHNLHWTQQGHVIAAETMAELLGSGFRPPVQARHLQ